MRKKRLFNNSLVHCFFKKKIFVMIYRKERTGWVFAQYKMHLQTNRRNFFFILKFDWIFFEENSTHN